MKQVHRNLAVSFVQRHVALTLGLSLTGLGLVSSGCEASQALPEDVRGEPARAESAALQAPSKDEVSPDAQRVVVLSTLSTFSNGWGVAVEGTHVYWAEVNAGNVSSVPKAGGATSVLFNQGANGAGPVYLAANSQYAYFTATGNCLDFGGLFRVPLAGGAAENLAPVSCGGYQSGVALDSANAYWTDGASVLSVPLGGGAVTTLASSSASGPMAISGSNLYVAGFGSLVRVPTSGGAAVTLASGSEVNGMGVAADAANVYWGAGDAKTGAILSQPLGGGATTTLASGLAQRPFQLAVSASDVYWTTYGPSKGAVLRVPLGGGVPTTLAANQPRPNALALDATHVYFTCDSDGSVRKTAR